MSDNSESAMCKRAANSVLQELEQLLNNIEVEAVEIKDFHTVQVCGRVRDRMHIIRVELDTIYLP
jgi:predicted component of type VI protein secretion system